MVNPPPCWTATSLARRPSVSLQWAGNPCPSAGALRPMARSRCWSCTGTPTVLAAAAADTTAAGVDETAAAAGGVAGECRQRQRRQQQRCRWCRHPTNVRQWPPLHTGIDSGRPVRAAAGRAAGRDGGDSRRVHQPGGGGGSGDRVGGPIRRRRRGHHHRRCHRGRCLGDTFPTGGHLPSHSWPQRWGCRQPSRLGSHGHSVCSRHTTLDTAYLSRNGRTSMPAAAVAAACNAVWVPAPMAARPPPAPLLPTAEVAATRRSPSGRLQAATQEGRPRWSTPAAALKEREPGCPGVPASHPHAIAHSWRRDLGWAAAAAAVATAAAAALHPCHCPARRLHRHTPGGQRPKSSSCG